MLFSDIIFGPVQSRRLGVSLGINLLPRDGKVCSFDCIYCECGLNKQGKGSDRLAERDEVKRLLRQKLEEMVSNHHLPNVITFAGNGEPTLHPEFEAIIDDTIALRDQLVPECRIAVLSNSTMITRPAVVRALLKVDDNILKLDAGTTEMMRRIDRPNQPHFSIDTLIPQLQQFNGKCIIQTLFVRGEIEGQRIDNTTPEELRLWVEHIRQIAPQKVMLYSIDRKTPFSSLEKIQSKELHTIALPIQQMGIEVIIT